MVVLFATEVVETEEDQLLDNIVVPRAESSDDDDDDDDWDLDADEDEDELEELGDLEDWSKVKDDEENGGW